MSDQMCKSICKSKALGETVERTAEMHGTDVETVMSIWEKSAELIAEYEEFYGKEGE